MTATEQNNASEGEIPPEYLPPVDPPSASFFMQLFVTPLLIVCAIVGLWFVASWLVNSEGRPEKLVDDIEQLNHGSWQKALTLANQLRNTRNHELRTNPVIAKRLAEVLTSQLQSAGDTDAQHWLTLYLCRALGEFEIDTGLNALVLAAEPRQTRPRRDPRRAAIEGIALLATHLEPGVLATRADAVDAVLKATEFPAAQATEKEDRREQRRLRATAAYALGVIGGDQAAERLKQLANDPDGDVRQNAVVGLARTGDASILSDLTELLPPSDELLMTGLDEELKNDSADRDAELEFKRNLTTSAAIQGLIRLMKSHRDLDFSAAEQALRKIGSNTKINATLRQEAEEALQYIERLRESSPSAPSQEHALRIDGFLLGKDPVHSIVRPCPA